LDAAKAASNKAIELKKDRERKKAESTVVPGVLNALLRSTGGICGVFMLACGPSMDDKKNHFGKCEELIRRYATYLSMK
jgi:hypothetical protein